MSALALNETLRTSSGVTVSNAGEPLQLVCNTGLTAIRRRGGNTFNGMKGEGEGKQSDVGKGG